MLLRFYYNYCLVKNKSYLFFKAEAVAAEAAALHLLHHHLEAPLH